MTGMNSMSLTDGYLSERQCGEPVCAGLSLAGRFWRVSLTVLACQRHLDDLERAKDPHWPYRFDKKQSRTISSFCPENASYLRGMGPA